MLKSPAAVVIISIIQLFPTQAAADYSRAERWFAALPLAQRANIQRSLTWTSGYLGFPDGSFGQRTFEALSKFETSEGLPSDGVLDHYQIQKLADLAAGKRAKVRFAKVIDKGAQAELWVPFALVTDTVRTKSGLRMSSAQKDIVIQTFRVLPTERSFAALFSDARTSTARRTVTSAVFKPTHFITRGYIGSQAFYYCAYNTDKGTLGVSLTWSRGRSEMQTIAIATATSLGFPSELQSSANATPEDKKATASDIHRGQMIQPEPEYVDLSGLGRPRIKFEADQAGCQMYAQQIYVDSLSSSSPDETAELAKVNGAIATRKKSFEKCMSQRSWKLH